MEGADELVSPLWFGARLVWAIARDETGSDYNSWIASLDTRTGRRTRVALPDTYILSLARAGGRLAVRYIPSDPSGNSIGPDPSRKRIGRLFLTRLR
jgi:hypothetical protein